MEKIHNLKWERLQNLFDTISWFLVKSPGFLPEISWFSKFWSGMSAIYHFSLTNRISIINVDIIYECKALVV